MPLKEASLHTELTMALKTYLSLDTLGAAKSVISKLGIKGQSYGKRCPTLAVLSAPQMSNPC